MFIVFRLFTRKSIEKWPLLLPPNCKFPLKSVIIILFLCLELEILFNLGLTLLLELMKVGFSRVLTKFEREHYNDVRIDSRPIDHKDFRSDRKWQKV